MYIHTTATCTHCKSPIQIDWNFCPHCGKSIQPVPLSTTLAKQLLIYSVSFFLPPFGLRYVVPYIKDKDSKTKLIGIIALLLTIISIFITIYSFKLMMDYYSNMLNNLSTGKYGY